MKNKYYEGGHPDSGDARSHHRQGNEPTAIRAAKPAVPPTPNRTLVELRDLKSLLQRNIITEAEYDARRNYILATF